VKPVLVAFVVVRCIVATATLSSCGAGQAALHAADLVLDCETPDMTKALADLVRFGIADLKQHISGDGTVDKTALRADLAASRSDLGRCVLGAAAVALDAAITTSKRTAMASAVPAPASMAAEFTRARGELAWPRVRVAGTVL